MKLRNMVPAFSPNNVINVLEGNPKSSCQFAFIRLSGRTQIPDLDNVSHRENMLRVLLSAIVNGMCRTPNSFIHRVLSIFLFTSNPKVVRVDAGGVVASRTVVQHAQSLWHWTPVENPRSNMGSNYSFEWSPASNVPVPKGGFGCSPKPARIGLSHLGPEATW